MASSPTDTPAAAATPRTPLRTHHYRGFDGADLVWHELAEGPGEGGRPVVMLHGFFSDAKTNWVRYGHAAALAAKGLRPIMPDLRGHGQSAKPTDASAYPRDALAMDGEALVEQLGLTDYDLVGYSLGARATSRMLARGATPTRVVFSGMGLDGLTGTDKRAGYFRNLLSNIGKNEPGSAEARAETFLRNTGGSAQAMLGIIDTFVDTPPDVLATFDRPTLVLAGVDDRDNGSAPDLAAALPNATLIEVPGGHMTAVGKPDLGLALAGWLGGAA